MNSKPPRLTWRNLKRGLLLFWAVLLTVVVATNACDLLKAFRLLPKGWWFASGNLASVMQVLTPALSPGPLTEIVCVGLFLGVIAWEALAAALFWRAGCTFRSAAGAASKTLILPFAVGLGLWGAFQLACESFPSLLAYQIASAHRALFSMQLATLLAMVLLPDDSAEEAGSPSRFSEPR